MLSLFHRLAEQLRHGTHNLHKMSGTKSRAAECRIRASTIHTVEETKKICFPGVCMKVRFKMVSNWLLPKNMYAELHIAVCFMKQDIEPSLASKAFCWCSKWLFFSNYNVCTICLFGVFESIEIHITRLFLINALKQFL